MKNIGFMQGRLSPLVNGKIQAFPTGVWQQEFEAGDRIGLHMMEWTLDYEGLHKNPLMTEDGRKEIRSLCEKYHFSIPSVTGDCFMQRPFYKENNKELISDLANIIIACGELGMKYMLIPLVDNGRIENEVQRNRLYDILQTMVPLLKEKKLKIIFESDFEPASLDRFISAFSDEYFGINYDTGNSASLGYPPADEFAAYGYRIDNVHIKDRLYQGTTVPLGEGAADFKEVFALLKRMNYTGNYILQTARAKNELHAEALMNYTRVVESFYTHEFTPQQ